MENKKKVKLSFIIIILAILTFIISFLISNKDDVFYYIKGYRNVKTNLYKKNDSLFLLKSVEWKEENKTIILRNYESNLLINGESKKLIEIIDVKTFNDKKYYYYDKNNVYIYNASPAFFPTLNAIKCKSKDVKFLGYDYYKIDNRIYFQSLEVKNANPKTFVIMQEHKDGYYYAKDDRNVFYKEKQIQQK